MVRVSLEVATGFVVQPAVGHQFLHAGESLRAAQGRTAEQLAWQGWRREEWGGVDKGQPGNSACLLP